MRKQLFQYAIIFNPETTGNEVVKEESKIITEPTTVLAKDGAEVNLIAAMSIPKEYADKLDKIQIVVRPF